jgi:hypothetical protein
VVVLLKSTSSLYVSAAKKSVVYLGSKKHVTLIKSFNECVT